MKDKEYSLSFIHFLHLFNLFYPASNFVYCGVGKFQFVFLVDAQMS